MMAAAMSASSRRAAGTYSFNACCGANSSAIQMSRGILSLPSPKACHAREPAFVRSSLHNSRTLSASSSSSVVCFMPAPFVAVVGRSAILPRLRAGTLYRRHLAAASARGALPGWCSPPLPTVAAMARAGQGGGGGSLCGAICSFKRHLRAIRRANHAGAVMPGCHDNVVAGLFSDASARSMAVRRVPARQGGLTCCLEEAA